MKFIVITFCIFLSNIAFASTNCEVEKQDGNALALYKMNKVTTDTTEKFYLLLENQAEFIVDINKFDNTMDSKIYAWPTKGKATIGQLDITLNKAEPQKITLAGFTGKTWVYLVCTNN